VIYKSHFKKNTYASVNSERRFAIAFVSLIDQLNTYTNAIIDI